MATTMRKTVKIQIIKREMKLLNAIEPMKKIKRKRRIRSAKRRKVYKIEPTLIMPYDRPLFYKGKYNEWKDIMEEVHELDVGDVFKGPYRLQSSYLLRVIKKTDKRYYYEQLKPEFKPREGACRVKLEEYDTNNIRPWEKGEYFYKRSWISKYKKGTLFKDETTYQRAKKGAGVFHCLTTTPLYYDSDDEEDH